MLVSVVFLTGFHLFQYHSLDFMAVRKIPLKERQYLSEDGLPLPPQSLAELRIEDPSVELFISQIRKAILSDRSLHDKVRMHSLYPEKSYFSI
jgi:hypothetical protein